MRPRVEELIGAAEADIGRLRRPAGQLRDKAVREIARHLAEVGEGVVAELAREPAKVGAVRRYLTHYLPKTVEGPDADTMLALIDRIAD